MPFEPERDLERISTSPGVYLMRDAQGTIFYVGKAANLRSRLRQYFGSTSDRRYFVSLLGRLLDDVEVGRVVSEPSFVVEPQRRALVKRFVGERPKDAGFFPHVLDTRGQRGQARRLAFVVTSDLGDDGVVLSVGLDAFVPGG